jgi:hypothetical protein
MLGQERELDAEIDQFYLPLVRAFDRGSAEELPRL